MERIEELKKEIKAKESELRELIIVKEKEIQDRVCPPECLQCKSKDCFGCPSA